MALYRECLQLLSSAVLFSLGGRTLDNRICRRGGNLDPERTSWMKDKEEKLLDELREMRSITYMRHFYENPGAEDSSWVPVYIKEVQDLLDCDLAFANRWMEKNMSIKGFPKWKEEVHARRRTIAIYHQEISLLRQGVDVLWLAAQCNESILAGQW